MTKELSRHEIREKALQALFPLNFNADLTKHDAICNAIELDHQELLSEDGEAFVPEYLDTLVEGVLTHQKELDEIIQAHLKEKWKLNRLAKMDLIILRIAIFELKYTDEIPNTVAVNEAVELTKTFSDDRSRKFVNGVLSNILSNMEETKE